MSGHVKRISLMIREDQHQKLLDLGTNVSGLVRDLIDDYLSDHKITLSVGPKTLKTYHQVVTESGAGDGDFEPYLVKAFGEMLKDRIRSLERLEKELNQAQGEAHDD